MSYGRLNRLEPGQGQGGLGHLALWRSGRVREDRKGLDLSLDCDEENEEAEKPSGG